VYKWFQLDNERLPWLPILAESSNWFFSKMCQKMPKSGVDQLFVSHSPGVVIGKENLRSWYFIKDRWYISPVQHLNQGLNFTPFRGDDPYLYSSAVAYARNSL